MRIKTHPGEIIIKEFLEPSNIDTYDFINDIDAHQWNQRRPIDRIHFRHVLRRKEALTEYDAVVLSDYFGTTTQFWINAQRAYDKSKMAATIVNILMVFMYMCIQMIISYMIIAHINGVARGVSIFIFLITSFTIGFFHPRIMNMIFKCPFIQ